MTKRSTLKFVAGYIKTIVRDTQRGEGLWRPRLGRNMEEIANKCRDMVIGNQEEELVFDEGKLIQEEKDMDEEEALNRSPRTKEDEEVDEGLMIRPPPEPPPRMMLEAGICLLCHFILFNLALLFLRFLGMNTVVVVFCIVSFCQTLTLGGGGEGFALATLGSFRPITGQANHIALDKVIGSPVGPMVGGWKCFLYHLYPLLNVLLLI
ncbi:unnamed protein product [Cuscuta epithymum]|uniref:Uncharacterized protein n=1 Tax=Cuscuta epithymum TaxID=186058 RepID=A0AAV0DZM0_9ASTE|nr:unnamed protein product [Cuscuta epithymum]